MKKGFLSVLLTFFFSSTVYAADIVIKSESLQEKAVSKQTKWVKAAKVTPGTKIRYVDTVISNGTKAVQNLVIINPIPMHMLYVNESAKCNGACSITYSLDGKVFDVPAKLFVTEKGKKRVAKATEYKAIRWALPTLGAKQSINVYFDATLE
jgi:uncharacterized repeat protein (TIGR01451 family)